MLVPEIKARAFDLLSRREHARHELLQKLLRKGHALDAIKDVLDYMAQQDYQSDERFAEHYVRSRILKGYGPVKIRVELIHRGVCPSIVDRYLAQDPDFWLSHLQHVHQKKFGRSMRVVHRELAKRYRFLLARGFTAEHIRTLDIHV